MSLESDFKGSNTIGHVVQFARQMETNFRQREFVRNDQPACWNDSAFGLLMRLRHEVTELELLKERKAAPIDITEQAADVANFALMFARAYGLPK
jgi:hypothetical protein